VRAGYAGTPTWKLPARRRRNRRVLALAAALAIVAFAAPALVRPAARALGVVPWFRAETVEIAGLLYLSGEEVRARTPIREGDNLLLLDPRGVEEELRHHPRIADARVSRMPGRVRVEIRERRTSLLVNAGKLLEVDAAGTILSPLERGLVADRPVLSGVPFPTVQAGARVTTVRLHDVLRLVSLLESPEVGLVSEVSEIVSETPNRALLRTLHDGIPILVDPERATLSSMRALAATMRDLRDKNRRVIAVDARYRGQVVVRCAPDDSLSAVPLRGTT
jgi:cell division septal protein FtsQ